MRRPRAGRRPRGALGLSAQVLSNLDIFQQAGGESIAIERTFSTQADPSGNIDVKFTSVTDFAKVSGIVVSQVPEPSTLALGVLELAAAGAWHVVWRRWRRGRQGPAGPS